jgi:hypothetical protein
MSNASTGLNAIVQQRQRQPCLNDNLMQMNARQESLKLLVFVRYCVTVLAGWKFARFVWICSTMFGLFLKFPEGDLPKKEGLL